MFGDTFIPLILIPDISIASTLMLKELINLTMLKLSLIKLLIFVEHHMNPQIS